MNAEVIVSVERDIMRLTLNRPAARNALTRTVCAQLSAAMAAAASATQCRALVIQGSGGSFASGADIGELNRLRGQRDALISYYRELRAVQEQLYSLPLPTIALVDGYCLGAGLSLAIACDLRLASTGSVFSAPPARLGLQYSDQEMFRLVGTVGAAATRDLLFTARRLSASEAFAIGLIGGEVEAEALEATLAELLRQLLACAPRTLRRIKEQLLRIEAGGGQRALHGDEAAEQWLLGEDAAEGMQAFAEKRAPRFRT
jgi:enoyl-CoA hydratase/carnithine racemase